ncbi:MAG: hypothetical protein KF725_01700 [Cyclobacteriaceae bacterium]|nr:hypothetical protein [Cyclobacteriaceae bacterium]UYN86837.1 MAG: hypothetical protein KIT51_00705 [Cyclobacteriaceae bacterium]
MKKLVLLGLFALTLGPVLAYSSSIAIQTSKQSSMQVYVNGKLYNKQPENFVRVKGNPGSYKIEVKVLNPYDKEWYMVRQAVRIEKGFEYYYKIEFSEGQRPKLKAIRTYPVYSHYFLNPALYNRHPTS